MNTKSVTTKGSEIAEVYDASYSGLCRYLESITREKATDIAQESFLRLLDQDTRDLSRTEMKYWLFKVGRNIALNEIGRSKTRSRLLGQITAFLTSKNPRPDEILEDTEARETIVRLVRKLPEHQRSALLLREQEEMSYREISIVLEVSESKVKSDIYRGRVALRKLWKETER